MPLTKPEEITLQFMRDYHPNRQLRMRALAVILSNKGFAVQEIALICHVCRQTVSIWLDNWDRDGLIGLYNSPRPGHPLMLKEEDVQYVMDLIEQEPRSTKKIVAALEIERGKKVSGSTVKRTLKKAKLIWKRVRKSTKPERDEQEFRKAEHRIKILEQRSSQGKIDLFFYDECGFCLTPSISYAWQPTGKYIEIPATGNKGHRLNVLAFLNKDNEIFPFTFTASIDTEAVIEAFDLFAKNLTNKTFVIIDNAPAHRSKAFIKKIPEWNKRGLIPKFLPSYSPELNLIEILWRKIKYEWLPFTSYINFNTLKMAVEKILKELGSKYVINFST
jgi:transposase